MLLYDLFLRLSHLNQCKTLNELSHQDLGCNEWNLDVFESNMVIEPYRPHTRITTRCDNSFQVLYWFFKPHNQLQHIDKLNPPHRICRLTIFAVCLRPVLPLIGEIAMYSIYYYQTNSCRVALRRSFQQKKKKSWWKILVRSVMNEQRKVLVTKHSSNIEPLFSCLFFRSQIFISGIIVKFFNMDILNIQPTDINHRDIIEVKSILEQRCPVLLHHASTINDSFINTIALSKKCNKPILTWIIDVYNRFLIDYYICTYGKILLPMQFIDNYLWMQHVPSSLYDSFKTVVMNFHRIVGSFPEIGSSVFKYDDNLDEYIQITNTINTVIKSV